MLKNTIWHTSVILTLDFGFVLCRIFHSWFIRQFYNLDTWSYSSQTTVFMHLTFAYPVNTLFTNEAYSLWPYFCRLFFLKSKRLWTFDQTLRLGPELCAESYRECIHAGQHACNQS